MSFVEIDINRLEEEWVKQPKLYKSYAKKAADAQFDLDEARAELEVVRAELDKAIRDKPKRYGIEKITEKTVENAIPLQEEYQKALKAFNKAKHRLSIVNAAVSALDHRKRALQKLVDLWIGDYFSTPTASSMSKEKMDEAASRSLYRRGQRKRKRRDDRDK